MSWVYDLVNIVHVTAGSLGLLAFWVPVFVRKGGPLHRRFGTIFKVCAYVVLAAAATTITLRAATALSQGVMPSDNPGLWSTMVFLGYLTVVVFVVIRHGVAVLSHKDLVSLNTPVNRFLAWVAMAASVGIVAYALILKPSSAVLFFALSPIGIGSGLGILKAIKGRLPGKRGWFYEHMGAMLGAGIAFHTAFAVFGINRLFDLNLEGWVALLPWLLPTVIGIPASVIWTRKYRRQFGDLPA